jgi:hypothetical protein
VDKEGNGTKLYMKYKLLLLLLPVFNYFFDLVLPVKSEKSLESDILALAAK